MTDLRIADAPELTTIEGDEKIPTGNSGGNFAIVTDALAQFVKDSKDLQSGAEVDAAIAPVEMEVNTHIADLANPHQITKEQVGLGNVDNTADADKPISSAVAAAITTLTTNKADKTYVDSQLALKADKLTTYTKTEVDTALSLKANQATTYTKTEVNTLLENKQERLSIGGTLTGVNSFDTVPNLDGLDGNPSSVMNQQAQALMNRTESLNYDMSTMLNYYDASFSASIGGYPLNSRVVLSNGEMVVSTISNNTNDPNVDMTGWISAGNTIVVDSIADMLLIQNPNIGDVVNAKGFYRPSNLALALPFGGGGEFIAVETSLLADGGNILNSADPAIKWARLNQSVYTLSNFGGKPYDQNFDNTPILHKILDSIYRFRVVGNNMHNGTPNCGGAVIDLEGAEWFLSTPFKYKPYGGNYKFQNGVISAASSFPVNEFLVAKDTNNPTSFNETNDYVTFDNVMFDGKEVASGLHMNAAIRMLVSKSFFRNVSEYGLYCGAYTIELFCSDSYFKNDKTNANAVTDRYAIYLSGLATDNHFTNILTQNFLGGVKSYATANTFKSVHCYGGDFRNLPEEKQANCFNFAFHDNTANNRLLDCYCDTGGRILLENPSRSMIRGCTWGTLSGNPHNAIVLKAVTNGHYCRGLLIDGNEFDIPSGSDAIVVAPDSSSFSATEFKNSFVGNNVGGTGVNIRSTRFTISSTLVKSNLANIDTSGKYLLGTLKLTSLGVDQSVKMLSVNSVTPSVTGSIPNGVYPLNFSANGHTVAQGNLIAASGGYTVEITNSGYYYDSSLTVTLQTPIAGVTVTFTYTMKDADNNYVPISGVYRSVGSSVLLSHRLLGFVRASFETSN